MSTQAERDELRAAIPELMRGPIAPMPSEFPRVMRINNVVPLKPRK